MGKKVPKDKKKVKGAEKTAAKTEKKQNSRIKQQLAAKGEDDVHTMLAKFEEAEKAQTSIVEMKCDGGPSKRSAFSVLPHPDKEQLIFFGGEYFNGTESFTYNDLFFYTPKQDRWHLIKSPNGPPPRSAHQMVATPGMGGQLWVFGGEFTSKSQTQFYHYKDFWTFSLSSKSWHRVHASGHPTSRSGHRMVVNKKKIFIFGGFQDNGYGTYKYFNDIHSFDLETYKWTKLEPSGKVPEPRSACGMAALSDGRILIYGGYSVTPVKGGEDQGTSHTDMFCLVPDKHDTTGLKCKWVSVKQGGDIPHPPRSSFSFVACNPVPGITGWGEDKAVMFGGVTDADKQNSEEADMEADIHDQMYLLDLTNGHWTELGVSGPKAEGEQKKSRRRKEGDAGEEEAAAEEEEEESEPEEIVETTSTFGAFTLTQSTGCTLAKPSGAADQVGEALLQNTQQKHRVFVPPPRFSAMTTVRRGLYYMYGGLYEESDRQLTLNDFYMLDLSKLEEWHTINALNPKDMEWYESGSEDESGEESGDDDDSEESDD